VGADAVAGGAAGGVVGTGWRCGTGRKFTNWKAGAAGTSLAGPWLKGCFAVKVQRPLVLVIEDSDDTRDVFAAVLHLEGFTVEEARDGREGIEKAAQFLPDIIITDLRMPVMDGREMIRRLRADQRTRRIPSSRAEERVGTGSTPADAFVPKPCPLDLLLLEVRGVLRRRAAA
jgi:CheY-like chemotaxis protein